VTWTSKQPETGEYPKATQQAYCSSDVMGPAARDSGSLSVRLCAYLLWRCSWRGPALLREPCRLIYIYCVSKAQLCVHTIHWHRDLKAGRISRYSEAASSY
jgi:hypothetical protein